MIEPITVDVQLGDLERFCKLAADCAEDLEAELRERWMPGKPSTTSSMERRFERDMEPVRELMSIAKRLSHRCSFYGSSRGLSSNGAEGLPTAETD